MSLTGFLGLRKNIAALLGAVVLLEFGERMGERFLPVYIMALGGGAMAVGILGGLTNLLGALYSFPGGWLSDRIGYRRSLIIFDAVAMAGYLVVVLIPAWQAAVAGSALFLCWSSVSLPAIMSAISGMLPKEKRTMGVSMHSIVRRIPKALGPLLGGACIAAWGETGGVRAAFMISFILALAGMFFQLRFIEEPLRAGAGAGAGVGARGMKNPLEILSAMDPDLKHLLVSDILVRFCEQIPYAFIVVWAMKHAGVSAVQFGWLTALEMIVAMVVYIPVAWLVEKTGRKKPFVALTFAFFALFPLVLMFARSFWMLALAFAVRGMKELGEPRRKALILDLAGDQSRATVYGAYYLIRDVIVSVAALGGGFLWLVSPEANLVVSSVFGVAAVFYVLRFCKA